MAETSLRLGQLWPLQLLVAGDSLDGEVGLTDHLGGTARCKQANIVLDEALGQVEQAGLVIDGQDG